MANTGRRLEISWPFTAVTVLMVSLMVLLGFWQLARAHEKRDLTELYASRQAAAALPLAELTSRNPNDLAYLSVELAGEFLPHRYFLLDNRIYQGRFGNEVVAVMQLAAGGFVLVNRGWVEADSARRSLPRVPTLDGNVRVRGHVYVPPGDPYLLGDQAPPVGWPKRMQAVQMGPMAEALEVPVQQLFPFVVRLSAGEPGSLTVDWQVVNVSPEKHQGYAAQWFTMAFVLALLYLYSGTNLWQLLRGQTRPDVPPQEGTSL